MRPVMTMRATHDNRGARTGIEDAAEGKFHAWGSSFEEFENGPANYTVALVEMPDGTVQSLMPWLIRFLDSDEAQQQALNEYISGPIIVG